jgi:methionine salvage enolase-phosphatase E1
MKNNQQQLFASLALAILALIKCVCVSLLFQVFTDYFDTSIGSKTEAASYKKIIEQTKIPADEILFLTDLPEGNIS